MSNREENNRKILQALGKMSRIAFSIVFSIIIGFITGNFLDKKLGTSPLLLIIGTIFGIMAAFKNLYDNTKKDREK